MKRIAVVLALLGIAVTAQAQSHYVRPYTRSDGTYVPGHFQTNPDGSRANNWSSQGNINPYTGQLGTVNPYAQPYPQQIQPIQPIRPIQPLQPLDGMRGRPF